MLRPSSRGVIGILAVIFVLMIWLFTSTVPMTTASSKSQSLSPISHDEQSSSSAASRSSFSGPHCHRISPVLKRVNFGPAPNTQDADVLRAPYVDTTTRHSISTVLDVGAYDGTDYSVPSYKKGHRVMAFELNPKNWKKVRQTLEKEGVQYSVIEPTRDEKSGRPTFKLPKGTKSWKLRPHVYFFQAGVGSKGTFVEVEGDSEVAHVGQGKSSNEGGGSKQQVAIVALDDVMQQTQSEKDNIFVMKIDTQGYEPEVVAGAQKMLSERRVDTIVLEISPKLSASFTPPLDLKTMLKNLYDWRYTCADMNVHPYIPGEKYRYVPPTRPSCIGDFVDFLRSKDAEDENGGWEDIVCVMD